MPEFHAEPYIYLPAVTHKSALVAWGAFYFRTSSRGRWKIVDDDDLKYIHPPRKDSIGAQSAPYGPARVEVYDAAGALASVARTDGRYGREVYLTKSRTFELSVSSLAALDSTRASRASSQDTSPS